ncbi:probable disease resistance protein RF9 [Magnolia sinica]|uniref:probable disease resistance protein RF9 n=1 Tax=Magnolia sinica TaxID=86752 RepID=UPI002658520C|nr:probable disease resistance protein RF9 [Magnolia sinica]
MGILGMKELEEWSRIEEGTMKSLHYLLIESCPKLKMLPDGFQHLAAIQHLCFGGMSEEFMKRVRGGGDDHLKEVVDFIVPLERLHGYHLSQG